jgi:hypothetical protein
MMVTLARTAQACVPSEVALASPASYHHHEDAAEVCCDLGWSCHEHGELDKAMTFLQQARRISEFACGKNHGVTLVVLDDLRDLLEEQGYEDLEINLFCSQVSQSRTWTHQAIENALNGHIQKAMSSCQQALIALPPSSPSCQLSEATNIARISGSKARRRRKSPNVSIHSGQQASHHNTNTWACRTSGPKRSDSDWNLGPCSPES